MVDLSTIKNLNFMFSFEIHKYVKADVAQDTLKYPLKKKCWNRKVFSPVKVWKAVCLLWDKLLFEVFLRLDSMFPFIQYLHKKLFV